LSLLYPTNPGQYMLISFNMRLIKKEKIIVMPITLAGLVTILLAVFISHNICRRFLLLHT
jgi:hypothetical protein